MQDELRFSHMTSQHHCILIGQFVPGQNKPVVWSGTNMAAADVTFTVFSFRLAVLQKLVIFGAKKKSSRSLKACEAAGRE